MEWTTWGKEGLEQEPPENERKISENERVLVRASKKTRRRKVKGKLAHSACGPRGQMGGEWNPRGKRRNPS